MNYSGFRPVVPRAWMVCLGLMLGSGTVCESTAVAGPVSMPDWVDPAAIVAAQASFPEAEAVRLLDDREVWIDETGKRRVRIQRVIHVREGHAAEEITPVALENYWLSVRSLRAWHQPATGAVIEISQPVISQIGDELYTDAREHALLIPSPGPGSIVAFEIEQEDRRVEDSFHLLYMPDIPVLEWNFRLHCPPTMQARAAWAEEAAGMTQASPLTEQPGEWSWSLREIDANRTDLVFVTAIEDPTGRACSFRDWPDVANWFRVLTYEALTGSPELHDAAESLRRPTASATLEEIAKFVQGSINYTQIYLADGGWRPHRASDVLRNRYGDCKDMAGLMVGLLDAAGIPASPALVRTTDPFVIGAPARTQFDHCIVALPDSAGDWRFFDPTSPAIPLGHLPPVLEGRYALIISPGADATPIPLPQSDQNDNRVRIRARLSLDGARALTGSVEERRSGHFAFPRRHWLRQEAESARTEKLAERMEEERSGVTVSNLEIAGLESASDTLSIRWTLEVTGAGRAAGPRLLLQVDPWRREATYFGSEIDRDALAFPYQIEREIEIDIPDGWSIEETPEDVMFSNDVGAVERTITEAGGVLHYRRVETNRVSSTPPDLEAALREWDTLGYRVDQQSVVLRKSP